jgi:putative membrane protein
VSCARRGEDKIDKVITVPPEEKRRPRAFRLDELKLGAASAPDEVPRGPVLIEQAEDAYEAEADALVAAATSNEEAIEAAQEKGIVARTILSWGGLFWTAAGGLVSLGISLELVRLIEGLFALSPLFGVIGLGLGCLAVVAFFVLAVREIAGIFRQRHIAVLHKGLAKAHETDDFKEARRLVGELASLYSNRPETAQARAQIRELMDEIVDGSDLIDIAERTLVVPLDLAVEREIANAAKRVSLVTTLAPRAIIDIIFVAAQAIRLIRRIATIYGGQPGLLGFIKLLRSIAAHLAITGGMAAGDSLLQQFVGHGIAARLSAKLGEGVLNGLLTARVGLSAMAVCRPLPFSRGRAPKLSDVAPFLFKSEPKT